MLDALTAPENRTAVIVAVVVILVLLVLYWRNKSTKSTFDTANVDTLKSRIDGLKTTIQNLINEHPTKMAEYTTTLAEAAEQKALLAMLQFKQANLANYTGQHSAESEAIANDINAISTALDEIDTRVTTIQNKLN
jgi:cell shape-determining protein MreC